MAELLNKIQFIYRYGGNSLYNIYKDSWCEIINGWWIRTPCHFSYKKTLTQIKANRLELPIIPASSLLRGEDSLNDCPGYDTKQSNGEAPVILQLQRMQRTPFLTLLPGLIWPGVAAPDWIISMGRIKLNCVLMLNWSVWDWSVSSFNRV